MIWDFGFLCFHLEDSCYSFSIQSEATNGGIATAEGREC